MITELKINDWSKVTIDITQEKKDMAFEMLLKWMEKYQCSRGEMLMDNDDCLIFAPNLIANIIDKVLDLKIEHIDEN